MNGQVVTVTTHELKRILALAIQNHASVLIVGKPGVGKSEIVSQAAQETDSDIIIDYPAVSEPTDYKGFGFPDWEHDQAKFLLFDNMKRLTRCTKSTVFFEDELGCAPESVQKALMHVNLTKHVNGIPLSEHVTIMAATNERWHKAGVSGLLETMKARFDTIAHVESDIDSWVRDYAIPKNLPVGLIAHERFRPQFINMTEWKPSPDMTNSPSPRTITKVAQWMQRNPAPELEYALYSGAAGKEYAADLLGFLKMWRALPNIDLIINNPDSEAVPTQPDVLFAVCAALASKAASNTMTNIIKYANRMPSQFSVMLVLDILAKDRKLAETKAFIQWSAKHSNVMLPF